MKTIPNLYYPQDITWPQLLFIVIPATILSVIIVSVISVFVAINYVWRNFPEISIYSHTGADNHDRTGKTTGTPKRS